MPAPPRARHGDEREFSHWLSKVLRHRAVELDISINQQGWVSADAVLNPSFCAFNAALLDAVVQGSRHEDGYPRFQVMECDGKSWIRATRHHTIPCVQLGEDSTSVVSPGNGPCATGHPQQVEASTRRIPRSRQEDLRLLSMFVAKLLRHPGRSKAKQLGLHVSEGGWVRLEEVLRGCHRTDGFVSLFTNGSLAAIKEIVSCSRRSQDDTPRFELASFQGVEWVRATKRSSSVCPGRTTPSSSTDMFNTFSPVAGGSTSDISDHESSLPCSLHAKLNDDSETTGELGKALGDFDGCKYQADDPDNCYLTFTTDTPVVLQRADEDGWSYGKIHDWGDAGWFPTSHWTPVDKSSLMDDLARDLADATSLLDAESVLSCRREVIHAIEIKGSAHWNTIIESELHLWPEEFIRGAMFDQMKEHILAIHGHLQQVRGGALVVVAPSSALKQLKWSHTDGGYMSTKMGQLSSCSDDFGKLLIEFAEHAAGDRWPLDHQDPEARGVPKDGAVLVHLTTVACANTMVGGMKTKAAAKILGLTAPCQWPNTGNRHETAGAAAAFLEHAVIFVRSSGSEDGPEEGRLHALLASDNGRKAYRLDTIDLTRS